MLHFDIGRKKSAAALNAAMEGEREIFLVAQKDLQEDDPKQSDLYACGVVASVRQVLRLPGTDNIRVVVEGRYRAGLIELTQDDPFLCGIVRESALSAQERRTTYIKPHWCATSRICSAITRK